MMLRNDAGHMRKVDGSRLMALSMWCLGQDVLYREGNLLTRFGMHRLEKPPGHPGTSAYLACMPSGTQLCLWGFGSVVSLLNGDERVSVLFDRDSFEGMILENPQACLRAFELASLGNYHRPITAIQARLCSQAQGAWLDWLDEYEVWLRSVTPRDYRRKTIELCRRPKGMELRSLSEGWALWAQSRSTNLGHLQQGEHHA